LTDADNEQHFMMDKKYVLSLKKQTNLTNLFQLPFGIFELIKKLNFQSSSAF
jgi:hypothetical protein